MAFLELQNVNIGYNKSLFENINLDAEKGELIAVIGKNGVGKTTLLKTISRIIPVLNGNILINEVNLDNFSANKLANIIGFSAIETISVSNLTVYDLIRIGRTPHTSLIGKLKLKDKQIINDAIEKTDLKKLLNNEISKISDGERQRAFIARLIAQETEILIFDEPTAFLDVITKHKIVTLFREIAKCFNKTVIFSTHDLKLAINTVDRIWLYNKTNVISTTPEDAILNNTFKSIFFDKNIEFNNFTADFDVLKPCIGYVNLVSNSNELRYIWTKNAVVKNGFKINNNADIKIIVNNNNWTLYSDNQTKKINSIYSLIKNLIK